MSWLAIWHSFICSFSLMMTCLSMSRISSDSYGMGSVSDIF